jgi:hypothetical protein
MWKQYHLTESLCPYPMPAWHRDKNDVVPDSPEYAHFRAKRLRNQRKITPEAYSKMLRWIDRTSMSKPNESILEKAYEFLNEASGFTPLEGMPPMSQLQLPKITARGKRLLKFYKRVPISKDQLRANADSIQQLAREHDIPAEPAEVSRQALLLHDPRSVIHRYDRRMMHGQRIPPPSFGFGHRRKAQHLLRQGIELASGYGPDEPYGGLSPRGYGPDEPYGGLSPRDKIKLHMSARKKWRFSHIPSTPIEIEPKKRTHLIRAIQRRAILQDPFAGSAFYAQEPDMTTIVSGGGPRSLNNKNIDFRFRDPCVKSWKEYRYSQHR